MLIFTPYFSNEDHTFTTSARIESKSSNSTSQFTSLHGLPSGTITSTAADGLIKDFNTGANQGRAVYLAFLAHYSYKGRYNFDFTVRRDGSTRFGSGRRWGTFPGFSFRWNASDEPFFKNNVKWLSMLSVRPGWGKVGNPPGGEYLYFSKYSSYKPYIGQNSTYPNNIRLTNLKCCLLYTSDAADE